ncbi:MAG: hypothetical protein ABFE08_08180 [Armatimonadia bacterium]
MADLSAASLFETMREEPWHLMRGDLILDRLGDHPLILPTAPFALPNFPGQAIADYSQLRVSLSTLKSGMPRGTKLPIDLSHLVELCKQNPGVIADEHDEWVYPYFYLELMAKEGTLKPIFWGHRLLPYYELDFVTALDILDGRCSDTDRYRELWAGKWQKWASAWIEHGLIIPDEGKPWLDHLNYGPRSARTGRRWRCAPEVETQEAQRILAEEGVLALLEYREEMEEAYSESEFGGASADATTRAGSSAPFSQCLRFDYLPFYFGANLQNKILWQMKLELWKTSIFNMVPITPDNKRKWLAQLNRFAIRYRRQSGELEKSTRFRKFVIEELLKSEGQAENADLVRQAFRQGLYPLRFEFHGYKNEDDQDLLNSGGRRVREIRRYLEQEKLIPVRTPRRKGHQVPNRPDAGDRPRP